LALLQKELESERKEPHSDVTADTSSTNSVIFSKTSTVCDYFNSNSKSTNEDKEPVVRQEKINTNAETNSNFNSTSTYTSTYKKFTKECNSDYTNGHCQLVRQEVSKPQNGILKNVQSSRFDRSTPDTTDWHDNQGDGFAYTEECNSLN
jgi:hypothetical protein